MSMHQRWRKISGNLGTYTSLQWLVRTQGLFRLICAVLLSSYQKVFKLKKRKKEEEVVNACTPEQEPFSDLSFPFRGWHYLWNAFNHWYEEAKLLSNQKVKICIVFGTLCPISFACCCFINISCAPNEYDLWFPEGFDIWAEKLLKIMDIFKQLCWYNHPHINTKDTALHGLE